MAEEVQRFRQYEYRANSNLVLTTDLHSRLPMPLRLAALET